jgi:hypothetical protein
MTTKIFYTILLIIFTSTSVSISVFASPFSKAQPVTVPGEVSDLYLASDGWSINPFINDMWGDTDKLLSGGNQIRYSDRLEDISILFGLNWRFFVPATEPKHAKPLLEPAPGHYADWLSLQLSALRSVVSDSVHLNLTLGVSHIGNHGAKNIHKSLHRLVGADLDGTDYSNQPVGFYPEIGAQIGWSPDYLQNNLITDQMEISLGVAHYAILSEAWAALNFVQLERLAPRWSVGLKTIWQLDSLTMQDDITAHRFEFAIGYRFNKYYTPTAVYVSPYVNKDQYPQIYLNLVSFNLPKS